jgi:pyruvate dehydrogenase E2 component (dihydrolipoamide acetyltransferase)
MASQVIMPKLSDAMEEGRVLQWMKNEGDRVQGGDVLASIETDKAEIELESFGAGVLRKILVPAGEAVPVGRLIAVVAEPDEDISSLTAGVPAAAAPKPAPVAPSPVPGDREMPPAPPIAARSKADDTAAKDTREAAAAPRPAPPGAPAPAAPAPARPAESGWIPASPIARRMARDAGLDLAKIGGSGPGGRILERDIEAFLATQAQRKGGAEVPAGAREFEDKDLSTIRKTIAARMVQSKAPIPHFTVTVEADMDAAQDLRASLNAIDPTGDKLSLNHILIKAVALALKRHPAINAAFTDGKVRIYNRVHIGVAVALEEGLIVPVIRECDRKSLGEIAREAKSLIERARAKKLRPEEYSGGTFAISNLGMYDVVEFTAVIDPAQGAILAVGAVEQKPVVVGGQVAIRHRMRLTGSFDHRIIDGAMAAGFLQEVKRILENPVQLLL